MTAPTIAECIAWVEAHGGYVSSRDQAVPDAILRILREADMPTRRALDEACVEWSRSYDTPAGRYDAKYAFLRAAAEHGRALRELK